MRIRNVWFDLLSFLVAIFFAASSVITIVDCVRGGQLTLVDIGVAGIFLLLATIYFRMSWQVGGIQRRIRAQRGR